MKFNLKLIFTCCSFLLTLVVTPQESEKPVNWNDELIYQVMPRSFYDSDGKPPGK